MVVLNHKVVVIRNAFALAGKRSLEKSLTGFFEHQHRHIARNAVEQGKVLKVQLNELSFNIALVIVFNDWYELVINRPDPNH